MNAVWAVAAGALVAVPILTLLAEEPDAVEQVEQHSASSDRAGIEVLVDRGNGQKGVLRIGL